MKKYLFFILFFSLAFMSFADNIQFNPIPNNPQIFRNNWDNTLGLDMPTYGFTQFDDFGRITGVNGPNIFLGYSWKNYFNPVVLDSWNPYWAFGTVVLIVPYIYIGADYIWENGYFFGASIGLGGTFVGIYFGKYF